MRICRRSPPPAPSTQPELGNGSVTVSAYSCPPTIENPSKKPLPLTKFCPHAAPASGWYGMLANETAPELELVELCQAQNCVPKPLVEWPLGVKTM